MRHMVLGLENVAGQRSQSNTQFPASAGRCQRLMCALCTSRAKQQPVFLGRIKKLHLLWQRHWLLPDHDLAGQPASWHSSARAY